MGSTITQREAIEAVTGSPAKNDENANTILKNQWEAWGFKEEQIGEKMLIPLSRKMGDGSTKAPLSLTGVSKDYENALERVASKGAVLGAAGVARDYEPGKNKAVDEAVNKAGPIDQSVVEEATPVAFDPRIMDILRWEAPIISDIPQVGQAGFKAKYNVISGRDTPVGYLSEGESLDLSNNKDSDHTLDTAETPMKIWVDKVNISDFTARAEASLGYMDVTQMTFGARVVEHALQKARTFFYGDSSAASGNNDAQDSAAYDGLAKKAIDGSNHVDKSGFTSSSDYPLMTDLKRELTKAVVDSGMTYNSARIACGPMFYDDLENELNPTVRMDSFDEGTTFGGRRLNLKNGVPVQEYPNIREYPQFTSTNFTPSDRDVFIYDNRAIQFRSLMPLTTVPLARVGLGNRAALAEFGSLIDKSMGEHTYHLSNYAQ